MHISSDIVISSALIRTSSRAQQLRPGMMLRGVVTGHAAGGRIKADFGGIRAEFESVTPKRAGDLLRARVIRTGEQIVLRLLPEQAPRQAGAAAAKPSGFAFNPALPAELRALLTPLLQAEDQAVRARAALIETLLLPLAPEQGTAALAEGLRGLIENFGAVFERKLAAAVLEVLRKGGARQPQPMLPGRPGTAPPQNDLLVLLTGLQELVDGAEDLQREAAADRLRDFLERYGRQRQSGGVSKSADQSVVLPLFFQDAGQQGSIKLTYPRRNRQGREPFRAVLRLSLRRLGAVRADFQLMAGSLRVMIYTSHEDVRLLLEPALETARGRLQNVFAHTVIACAVKKDLKTAPPYPEQDGTETGDLDMRI